MIRTEFTYQNSAVMKHLQTEQEFCTFLWNWRGVILFGFGLGNEPLYFNMGSSKRSEEELLLIFFFFFLFILCFSS